MYTKTKLTKTVNYKHITKIATYNTFWNESRTQKADELGYSKNEVMTLASIVYEESKQKSEQPRVAGVYINRLKLGMPLQADPTLKFAAYKLPKYANTVIKRVLNVHKEIDSPYNTYKYAGLPPGLITMPDLSAIEAVLNYENTSKITRLGHLSELRFTCNDINHSKCNVTAVLLVFNSKKIEIKPMSRFNLQSVFFVEFNFEARI